MSSTAILAYIVLALTIGYTFVYPAFGEISTLMSEKEKYEKSLKKVAQIENRKNELLSAFNQISEADKESINAVLPDSLNYTKLIADIDAIATRYGIAIDKISKRELDSSTGGSIEEAGPSKSYRSGIISFAFDSSYQNFSSFLEELEQSLRILDVRSLKVGAQPTGLFSYQIEFEAYWLE